MTYSDSGILASLYAKFGSTVAIKPPATPESPAHPSSLYAEPPTEVIEMGDCHFYHVMDIPGYETTGGHWDLRGKIDEYLGNVNFNRQRVLEIGPASGQLTCEMEKRGAKVVAVEVTEDPGWDFVPYPDSVLAPVRSGRKAAMRAMKKSFWLTHKAFDLKAKMHYGDVYNLPDELGKFDIAVMAAVLLHTKNPVQILAECAKKANTIIVTEMLYEDLEPAGPVARLYPTVENQQWDTWWHFTSKFFESYLAVMGFTNQTLTYHKQSMPAFGRSADYFTLVASR